MTGIWLPKNHVRNATGQYVIGWLLVLITPHLAPHRKKWFKSRPTPHQTCRPTVKHESRFKFDDEGADDDGSETDGSLFRWEEEATLLSDLMEEE
jgi:hypothetical protein